MMMFDQSHGLPFGYPPKQQPPTHQIDNAQRSLFPTQQQQPRMWPSPMFNQSQPQLSIQPINNQECQQVLPPLPLTGKRSNSSSMDVSMERSQLDVLRRQRFQADMNRKLRKRHFDCEDELVHSGALLTDEDDNDADNDPATYRRAKRFAGENVVLNRVQRLQVSDEQMSTQHDYVDVEDADDESSLEDGKHEKTPPHRPPFEITVPLGAPLLKNPLPVYRDSNAYAIVPYVPPTHFLLAQKQEASSSSSSRHASNDSTITHNPDDMDMD